MTLTIKQIKKAHNRYDKLIAECQEWLQEEFRHTNFKRYDAFLIYCRNHLPPIPRDRAIMKRAITREFKRLDKFY